MQFLFWAAVGVTVGVVFGSFFEWALHRFLMHKHVAIFSYPFSRHTLTHHRVFRADHTYHLVKEEDKHTIPMAWWNGPLLVALGQLPFIGAAFWVGNWGLVCGTLLAYSAYYGVYEYLHWCMHLPKRRHFLRSGIFFRLNGHHLLHHRYMNSNFNVVLPLADACFGTLLLRSKVKFAQAIGPSVPNVQPRVAA